MTIDTNDLPEARQKAAEWLQRAMQGMDAARKELGEAQRFNRQVWAAESLAVAPAALKAGTEER